MTGAARKAHVGVIDACGVAAALGLAAAAYWAAVKPVLTQRESRQAQVQRLAQLRTETEEGSRTKEKADSTIAKLTGELAGCEVQLLPVSTLNKRLVEIGIIAAQNGMTVETLRGDDAKSVGQRLNVPIRLVARGSYPACAAFLGVMSNHYRDTAVEHFGLVADRSDNAGGSGTLTVDFTWFAVSDGAGDVAAVPNP